MKPSALRAAASFEVARLRRVREAVRPRVIIYFTRF